LASHIISNGSEGSGARAVCARPRLPALTPPDPEPRHSELEKRLDISPLLLFIYEAVTGNERYGFESRGKSRGKTAEGMRKPGSHEGSLKPKEGQK